MEAAAEVAGDRGRVRVHERFEPGPPGRSHVVVLSAHAPTVRRVRGGCFPADLEGYLAPAAADTDLGGQMASRTGGKDLAEVAWWTVVAFCVWCATLGALNLEDAAIAAGSSLATGLVAWHSRRAMRARWRLRPAHLRSAAALPAVVLAQAPRVLAVPWRGSSRGRFDDVDAHLTGRGALAAGDRAAATLLVSFSPGQYVYELDPRDGRLHLHRLARGGPPIEEWVAR